MTVTDLYPLMEHGADKLKAASGRPLSEVNLEAAANGDLSIADLGVSADTLRAQAEIARQAGYTQLAGNLLRAAELTAVPNEELLQMYEMLRPGRCTYEALMALAEKLEVVYNAPENSRFVQEAAAVYRMRGLLRRVE
jgi:propanediol dehydratase small subunit